MIQVYIVDDHPLFIDGVKSIFNDRKDNISIAGFSHTVNEAINTIKKISIDVVIIDIIMPGMNGLDLFLMLKLDFPHLKTIILTGPTNKGLLLSFWNYGADALLVKHCGKQELLETIQAVVNNERIVGKNTICLSKTTTPNDHRKQYALTYRELQILNFLEKKYNRESVAKILDISKSTINFHCRNIFKKFDKGNLNSVLEEARKVDIVANFNSID